MSYKVIGTPFFFGVPDPLPEVPEGWVISAEPDEFLQVTDHQARTWYLTADGFAMRVFPQGENQQDLIPLADIAPPPWRVIRAAEPDQPHELHFEGEPQTSIYCAEDGPGFKALVDLCRLLNRRGISAAERRQILDNVKPAA